MLSLSPELFVRHTAGELVAKPMKGTATACNDDDENRSRSQALAGDPKSHAENVMIIDLLRSDLGRIAKAGTVQVTALFEVARFGDVLQMTSTVIAKLHNDCTLQDIFSAIYPCGSITGAPKRRTMQIIDQLETQPRDIYTGAIGWFDPSPPGRSLGDFCMSVPIRTLVLQPARARVRVGGMGVGSGIVADSDPKGEFEECRLKANFLTGLPQEFELIETMRATRKEGCVLLQRHLARLTASAQYFGIACDLPELASAIQSACAVLDAGKAYRLRVTLGPTGTWCIQASLLAPPTGPFRVFVAKVALDEDDLFLRHKSTVRTHSDAGWKDAEARGGFDCIFFNRRGDLAQAGRTNVFLKLDGRWTTPPLASGALPGVMRAVLLADERWGTVEHVLTRDDLHRCDEIVVCSALRGTVRANLCEEALVG